MGIQYDEFGRFAPLYDNQTVADFHRSSDCVRSVSREEFRSRVNFGAKQAEQDSAEILRSTVCTDLFGCSDTFRDKDKVSLFTFFTPSRGILLMNIQIGTFQKCHSRLHVTLNYVTVADQTCTDA